VEQQRQFRFREPDAADFGLIGLGAALAFFGLVRASAAAEALASLAPACVILGFAGPALRSQLEGKRLSFLPVTRLAHYFMWGAALCRLAVHWISMAEGSASLTLTVGLGLSLTLSAAIASVLGARECFRMNRRLYGVSTLAFGLYPMALFLGEGAAVMAAAV
jgi:hypothetical protein